MVGRGLFSRAASGFTMPAFERLAPPPPPDGVVGHLDAASAPGDIVIDLHGRGGWVARAAIDRQRRALTIESNPLTRLLAEVVLRPPDLRHLDAAFSTLGASPRGDSSLKLAIGAMFATRCPTCERSLIADEFTWTATESARSAHSRRPDNLVPTDNVAPPGTPPDPSSPPGTPPEPAPPDTSSPPVTPAEPAPPGMLILTGKTYRCVVCRDQRGGLEQRQAAVDDADRAHAEADVGALSVRASLRERFPAPDGPGDLAAAILDLHTGRQLVGLGAILERIEGDLRAAPVESALRLAFLHTVLPASRLGVGPGRLPGIRIARGTVRSPLPESVRERNPWLAFEEGFRMVRAFVQRIESGAVGPLEARLGTDLRSLGDGSATAVIRIGTPGALSALAIDDAAFREPGFREPPGAVHRPRIRLVLGQPPLRFNQERLAAAYHGTCWALGREAAAFLPLDALGGAAIRTPWAWQTAALRRSLQGVVPLMARDGRVILMLESGGPEALAAAALGGIGAGFRLLDARLADPEDEGGGVVELIPPGAAVPPGPRTRSGRPLGVEAGGAGDPMMVPGPGIFSAPERVDARSFSPAEAQRTITEVAVDVLRQRGEPARFERLLGEILIGLDRAGHLQRFVAGSAAGPHSAGSAGSSAGSAGHSTAGSNPAGRSAGRSAGHSTAGSNPDDGSAPAGHSAAGHSAADSNPDDGSAPDGHSADDSSGGTDAIERLLAMIRGELSRPSQQRLAEIAAGQWWLTARPDREAAAVPLADRVEWAVYSLLSTAGPIGEESFLARIAALFSGRDQPDEDLVRACLASYRSPASTAERVVTADDLRRRTADHTELLARLADAGHRLGMHVWIGRREQTRRFGSGALGDLLERHEQTAWLPSIARASAEDLAEVDCIWYVRGRTAFLFEVEWTAMLGDVVLRRHARIPTDDRLVRFLVVAPERAALVRHKLDASPILEAAIREGNWHFILWPELRTWLDDDPLDLALLEPHLGLEPAAERRGEQLDLFPAPDALR